MREMSKSGGAATGLFPVRVPVGNADRVETATAAAAAASADGEARPVGAAREGLRSGGRLHPRRVAALRPHVAGWLSHESAESFLFQGPGQLRYDRPIRKSADLFEGGTCNAMGFAALGASLQLIQQLGVEAIYRHVSTYLDELEPGLVERGFVSLRSPDPAKRSAILSVAVPLKGTTVLKISRP